MKLLSSDYDRTLKTFEYDLYINKFFIERFRKKKNIFLLNTGRCFVSIKKEIDKYHINYDYLSCCDGNLILDRNHRTLRVTNLDITLEIKLRELQAKYPFIEINPIKYENDVLEYEIIAHVKDDEFSNALRIMANNSGLSVVCFDEWRVFDSKPKKIQCFYLCDKKISKATSTAFVGELENIPKRDIFTIGDHHNDVSMVREFNGYTLPWGKKAVKEVSNGICLSVASLIKKISR